MVLAQGSLVDFVAPTRHSGIDSTVALARRGGVRNRNNGDWPFPRREPHGDTTVTMRSESLLRPFNFDNHAILGTLRLSRPFLRLA